MNPAISTSLNFRLLCAAGSAYDIAPGGCAYSADTVFSPVVAYKSAPKPVCGGLKTLTRVWSEKTPTESSWRFAEPCRHR
jgi:hypothetical protein